MSFIDPRYFPELCMAAGCLGTLLGLLGALLFDAWRARRNGK